MTYAADSSDSLVTPKAGIRFPSLMSTLLRFFESSFTTVGQKGPSPSSLANDYFNFDTPLGIPIRDTLSVWVFLYGYAELLIPSHLCSISAELES